MVIMLRLLIQLFSLLFVLMVLNLKLNFPVTCDEITDPLVKYYIYGDPNRSEEEKAEDPQLPFKPGYWSAAAMRFSSTEGAHLPTIPDEVYFGLKTLIFDVSGVDS